jgi:phospholipid/cholesterol/gamma-HCH transport system substrate-binding protein
MNERFPLLKFSIFAVVCLGFTAWLVIMIGNVSFESRATYAGDFTNVQGLLVNDDVKVAGVTVGKVESIEHQPGGTVRVSFSVRDDIDLPEDSTLTIRWRNVLGLRFLYVEPGGEGAPVEHDHVFAADQTRSPADLGSLLQRMTPFVRALEPELQNQVLQAFSEALVGNEEEVRSLISQGAELTQTIASRDAEIESLLTNSVTVLDAYARREQQLRGLLDSFAEVSDTLASRNDELEAAIVALADGQEELQRFVETNRADLEGTIDALGDLSDVLGEDHDQLSWALESTPRGLVGYHLISRTGQWFNNRAVGASVGDVVVTTERGAAYPRPDGSADRGRALSEFLGGGLG